MESTIRLGNHQIDRRIDKIKNFIFVSLARMRNRFMFYWLPIDKNFYKSFFIKFYRRQQALEKISAYSRSELKR